MRNDDWDGDERRSQPAELIRLHERIDELLKQVADLDKKVSAHLITEEELAPAIRDLATLWRGSKLIIPIITGAIMLVGSLGGSYLWVKDHIK